MVFGPDILAPPSRPRGYVVDIALLLVCSTVFLVAVILWFDNAQGSLTGNGVIKSLELRPWIYDRSRAPLFPSNYLFYPIYGLGCRILDLIGIFAGDPRRQLTVLNALSASGCLAVVYLLVRSLTHHRGIALLAALFHIACSFVLLLAITNEDIMPGYTAMFAAMAAAAVSFAEPRVSRVVVVGVLFSVGWLFEWRLMFPTLPAMLVALWLCEGRLPWRFLWIGLFLLTVALMAGLAAWLSSGHPGAVGPLELLWTGKGVASVWAGFTWSKLHYMTDGIAAYLLGTGITTVVGPPGWEIWRWLSISWSAVVAIIAVRMLWRADNAPQARAVLAVFGVTFVAGEIFNLYAQPQDPQMQINVMGWLTVGWALVLMATRLRWGRLGLASLGLLTAGLLVYNLWSLAPQRGKDTAWARAIERLEKDADPSRTVFLLHDFDWAMTYAALHWGLTEPGTTSLGPAPQPTPKFKWIGFAADVLRHPDWTVERHVEGLRRQIDRAFELGYDVLIVRLWDMKLENLEGATGMIVDSRRLDALSAMVHRDFTASLVADDPLAGRIYRLQRAAK